ncbi:hypothetical protein Tco_1421571 [Tanacetum coccineum]
MLNQQDIYAVRAERLAKIHDPLALMANTQTPFHPDQLSHITYMQHTQPNNNYVQQPPFNTNYVQQPMQNPKDVFDPTTTMNMALVLMAKAFKLTILQQLTTTKGFHPTHATGRCMTGYEYGSRQTNANGWRNCIVKPRKKDVAYLKSQLQIAQKEEAVIQLNYEEFDFMVAVGAYDKIEEVNVNYTLKDNLQQASTSSTQTDKAPIFDSDGSAELHHSKNCYDNDIFNMFTQEEQYTELLEPISEPHQIQHNDSNVISVESSMEHNRGIVEQHPVTVEETRAYFKSLYNNLAIEVKKVNSVNHKMKETNAELTTELARYKNQEIFFEINQEKYDKLERCYQKSIYQFLIKKINAFHLSYAKTITTLNEKIANLNNQLSKEKSTVSYLQERRKI